jgi:alpha 1,3-mannosyltransferase
MYLKVFAILFSKFREVISMEADVFFFQNPEAAIFSDPLYEKHGALFYNDRMELNPHSEKQGEWLKGFLPNSKPLEDNRYYKGSANYQLDHGVVAVDKSKHFWGLLGTACISWGQSREAFTSLILEKEAFWVGYVSIY